MKKNEKKGNAMEKLQMIKPVIWRADLTWFCSLARELIDPDSYYCIANGPTPLEAYRDWIRIMTRDYI